MGCGVRHAGCGLCAPAARGRERESGEAGDSRERQHRRWYCTALWVKECLEWHSEFRARDVPTSRTKRGT